MKRLSYLLLTLIAGFPFNLPALEINPGQLAEEIGTSTLEGDLTVEGSADIRDLLVLRTLPAKVKKIDMGKLSIAGYEYRSPAFMGKSLFKADRLPAYIFFRSECTDIVLPKDIKVIEAGAFAASDLESIEIPEGVTEIGDYAFYDCPNLRTVILPSTLMTLGKGAFANCPRLADINISGTGITVIPEKCFSGDSSLESLDLFGIKEVGSEAFRATALTSLLLPEVVKLAPYALAGMPWLTELTLNSEAQFNEGTLMNDTSLIMLDGTPSDIPPLFAANCVSYVPTAAIASAGSIGNYAFSNSGCSEIILGKNLTSVGSDIFHGMSTLSHIDATSLDANIPDTSPDAFAGITPAEVKLKVSDDSINSWKAHPTWGQFDVYSSQTVGGGEIMDEDPFGLITVRTDGDNLIIESREIIENVDVWELDGTRRHSLLPDSPSVSIPLENENHGVWIIKIKGATSSKNVKVLI